ncbi:MAG: ATP-binding protein [Xanthomonadales bacterium]|nr:ATP-binding protein [Xanthomonadales bacterium]
MKLRTKLLALSLLTLLLPWSGWKLLQELERYLREAQEDKLLSSARTLAAAMPFEYQTRLIFMPDLYLPLRRLLREPMLDGYADDWPDAGQGLRFQSADGRLIVDLLAGSHGGRLYLLFELRDALPATGGGAPKPADAIELAARNPRGFFRVDIRPEAPGPLHVRIHGETAGQVDGYWLDSGLGYRAELSLPLQADETALSFRVEETTTGRHAGPLGAGDRQAAWISLVEPWTGLSAWLRRSAAENTRIWLVDRQGWVLAGSGESPFPAADNAASTTWVQRLLYRLVAGSRPELGAQWPLEPLRLDQPVVRQALAGNESIHWLQVPESAEVMNTVAVPLRLEGEVHGTLVLQSASEGLLLITNRALGRLVLTTLGLALGLAVGLWYFATRLSRRVERLSNSVSQAMAPGVDPEILPLTGDRDELGELARNNERLLRAVADYSQYLQTLAGKLSHELKTPLAITRSSLDNLANQELDEDSRRFLERAREGLDRQTGIVRAMSEASRLETAIEAAEWEDVDLVELVRNCVDGYRSVHRARRLSTALPEGTLPLRCAPDLLAQALDKLVDNAISLSGEEDVITVDLIRRNGHCRLAVRNSGSRLPAEFQQRLFDSLVSLRERRGTVPHLGLGLYIVRLVAAAHRGTVAARNLPDDAGVEFVIDLPLSPPT